MFVVNVYYEIQPGKREAFLQAVKEQDFLNECRKEKGNLGYDYFLPVENENEVFCVEKWEEKSCWDAHRTAPHTVKFQDIKALYVTGFRGQEFESKE